MEAEIHLETIARFGKRDGASDYNWLFGRELLPAELPAICETLSRQTALTNAFFSLVSDTESAGLLVRTYFHGTDNVHRPVVAVEVARLVEPPRLSLEQYLWLAGSSIQPAEREFMGGNGPQRLSIAAPQADPEPLGAQDELRARLGLPLSVSSRAALSLIKQHPWRYAGICFATRTQSGAPPEWLPELAPYFCVNFGPPALSEEQRSDMAAMLEREITPEEWQALDQLETREAWQALRWAARQTPPCPARPADERWRDWLAAFRRAMYDGARLLATLRRDLHPAPLPASLIGSAAPQLSVEAVAFLAACTQGTAPPSDAALLEELARDGYLYDPATVPLSSIAPHVATSSLLAEQVLLRLERLGIERATASFLLDMKPGAGEMFFRRASFLSAIKTAHEHGVPAPRRNVLALLREADEGKDLWPLEALSQVYGGWARTIFEMIESGHPPAAPALTPMELRAVADLRQRFYNNSWEHLDVIAELWRGGRREEAIAFFTEVGPLLSSPLSAGGLGTLAARLGLGAPATSVPLGDLACLCARDLARPEDLLPADDGMDLADYARAWPATEPLADLVEGVNGAWPAAPPEFPAHWRTALRHSLSAFRLKKWVQNVLPAQTPVVLSWIARLYELDQRALQSFGAAEAIPTERAQLETLLPWIELFLAPSSRAQRLSGLGNAARAGVAHNDEQLARRLVHAVLPDENEHVSEFAVHALTGQGPVPLLDAVQADLIVALLPNVDVQTLIDRLFISTTTALSADPSLGEALVERLCREHIACPERGYTAAQRARHLFLAAALARAPGWEHLSPKEVDRRNFAEALLRRLELHSDQITHKLGEGESS